MLRLLLLFLFLRSTTVPSDPWSESCCKSNRPTEFLCRSFPRAWLPGPHCSAMFDGASLCTCGNTWWLLLHFPRRETWLRVFPWTNSRHREPLVAPGAQQRGSFISALRGRGVGRFGHPRLAGVVLNCLKSPLTTRTVSSRANANPIPAGGRGGWGVFHEVTFGKNKYATASKCTSGRDVNQ